MFFCVLEALYVLGIVLCESMYTVIHDIVNIPIMGQVQKN